MTRYNTTRRRRAAAPLLLLLCLAVMASGGCATISETLNDDQTQEELFRLAQDAYNGTRYELALIYYDSIVDRFNADRAIRVSAEYEMAYIHFHTGNTEEAKAQFATLLAEYRLNPVGFPRWVFVLTSSIYDQLVEQ